MYIVTTAPTTIVSASTYYKLAGTTGAYVCDDFSHSNNRLTYLLELTRKFLVNVSFSISSSEKDVEVSFQLYKNGGAGGIVASRIKRTLRATGDIFIMSLSSVVEISQNDYIELWGTATIVDGTEITLETLGLTVWG